MNYAKFLMGAMCLLLLIGCANLNKNTKDKLAAAKQPAPKLTKPVARKIWIEPQVLENGSIYVEGHWKYVLQKESTWTK